MAVQALDPRCAHGLWKDAVGFTPVLSSEPWFSEVTMMLKFMTSLVVLHTSECDIFIPGDDAGTPTGSHCD